MRSMRHFFFFLSVIIPLFSEEELVNKSVDDHADNEKVVELKGLPSYLIEGCVNPVTGNFTDYERDIPLKGPHPIGVDRVYSSGSEERGILENG